jgi:hypothetical protein
MDSKVRQAVFDRATPFESEYAICEVCGQEVATECHHSIGGTGKRKQHESVESCYALGNKCHGMIESMYGHDLRMKLILTTQRRYLGKGLSEDKVRVLMGGKIYKEEI